MSLERDRSNNNRSSRYHDYLIKLRGISCSSTKDDIKKFLHPCRIVNIYLFNNKDKSSGECLVDLQSETDVRNALEKTNQYLESRYIEIFRSTNYEYNFFIKNKGTILWREPVLRMNGLPYSCTMGDVQLFFKNIEIARNGIYITRDMSDNALGGGYVAFVSMDNAYKAIDLYNQKRIEHRYIELIPSTYDEAEKAITNDAYLNSKRFSGEDQDETKKTNIKRSRSNRQSRSDSRDHHYRSVKRRSTSISPRSRTHRSQNHHRQSHSRSPIRRSSPVPNENGEYLIKMRGMPYTVVESDICQFFPSTCQPVRIDIIQDRRLKRPNGDGHVYFSTKEEVIEAMKCDRKYMGNRYIELYNTSIRHSSSSNRRSDTPPHSSRSRSRSKTKTDNLSRSRSQS
ncbi:hypothetical protein I4U23_026529 [Adineta vaga]|nr:hypothetical protein I4U23_026529 [Adineta vaga]